MPTIYGNITNPALKKKKKPGVATPLTGIQANVPGSGSPLEQSGAQPPQLGGVYGEEKEPEPVSPYDDPSKKKDGDHETPNDDGGDDEIDELVDMRAQHEKELRAAQEEQRVQRAKGLMDVRARAGVGGLGLSGAATALEGDFARARDRSDLLAIAEMREGQRDEEWKSTQRRIALDDLEQAMDEDLDGDGDVGGQTEAERKREQIDERRNDGGEDDDDEADYDYWDKPGPPRGGQASAEDIKRAQDWPGETPLLGVNVGHDDTYNYVLGIDGQIWRVPHTGAE